MWLCVAIFAGAAMAGAERPAVEFVAPDDVESVASEGWLTLSWRPIDEASDGAVAASLSYEVQHARDPQFERARITYAGEDTATFVSGLRGGLHYFRVRAVVDGEPGAWNEEPRAVDVAYASMRMVTVMMLLGAGVLVATVTAIVRGMIRHGNAKTGGQSQ